MPSRGMALRTGRARSLPAARLRWAAQPSQVATVLRDYVFGGPPPPVLIPYSWLATPGRFRPEPLINVATISQADGGPSATSINTASRTAYGQRQPTPLELNTDCLADMANLAAWLTTYRATPRMRQPALLLIDLNARTADECMRILRMRQGDRIVVVLPWSTVATDPFSRELVDDWGSTPAGQPWGRAGGSASDFDVTGGRGLHLHSAAGSIKESYLDIGSTDFDLTVSLSWPVNTATGANITRWICGRYTDNNNYYVARCDLTTAGTVVMSLRKRIGGALTTLVADATVAGSYVADTLLRVHFRGEGTDLFATGWNPALGPESPVPTVLYTDPSPITTGTKIALLDRAEAGNTNVPVTLAWDDLTAAALPIWPQGTASLVVEGVAHASQRGERKVAWVTSAIPGTIPGTPGPWFRWGSSVYGSADVIPF